MQNEIIYPASRVKALLLLFACIAFVAMGIFLSKQEPLVGWAGVAIFGLGLPTSLLMLFSNKVYLRLSAQGFEIGSLFGTKLILWGEVERFYIGAVKGTKMIAIVYRPGYSEQQVLRTISSSLTGIESAIPNSYTASLEEILKTLNEWHARYARTGD